MTPNRFIGLKSAFPVVPPAARAALAGVVITCLFFVLVLLLIRPSYGVNDDAAIIEMIKGGYIIPYIDSTYSSLLHLLYVHVSPEFPWYGTCLLIVLGISAATLVGVTVHYHRGYPRLLLVLLILGLYFPFVVTVDYSMASIMGSAGAVAAALVLLLRDALTGLRALLLGLLATVSMWLRLDGIVATAAFTAPVVLTVFILCLRRQAGRNVFKYAPLLLCAVPLAASFTVDSIHKVYYSSPQYREYVEWSNLRGAFHADPISRINYDNPAVLSATGWSKADYDNLMGWFFIDENLYNVQSMTAFFDTAKKSSITAYPAEYFLDNLRDLVVEYWHYWLLICGAMLLALSLGGDGRLRRWVFLPAPLYIFGFIYVMATLFRYPMRVAEPSISAFALAYIFSVVESSRGRGIESSGSSLPFSLPFPFPFLGISLTMIAAGLFLTVQQAYSAGAQLLRAEINYVQNLEHLNSKYAGYYVMIQPGPGIQAQLQSPLESLSMDFHPIDVGWQTFSPLFYDQMRGLGVERGYELPAAMVNNDHALILARADWADRVVNYLHDHGHMPAAHKVVVEKLPRRVALYRIVNP